MNQRFEIFGKPVGTGAPCFLIAEAGSNHNGSLEQAHALIDAAAEAGACAVKFQTFSAKRLYPRSAGTSDYLGLSMAGPGDVDGDGLADIKARAPADCDHSVMAPCPVDCNPIIHVLGDRVALNLGIEREGNLGGV
jgi:hypothetical protein